MKNITKKDILSALPKGFKCYVSKNGLTVQLAVDTAKVCDWDTANRLVYDLAKKLKLTEVGTGTDLQTGVRDWEFTVDAVEKQMCSEANDVLKCMKSFFKKWGNSYVNTDTAYDIIEDMRALVATDEN